MLKDEDGNEHFKHHAKASILYRASKDRLGTSMATQNPLLLQHLLLLQEDLSILEAPFTQEEIDNVIKNMSGGKSPGPDGFNVAILKKLLGHHCS